MSEQLKQQLSQCFLILKRCAVALLSARAGNYIQQQPVKKG